MFWTKLGFTNFYVEIFNVNRGQSIIFDKLARDDDGVIHVVTTPWHEGNEKVATESEFIIFKRSTFDKSVTRLNFLTTYSHTALVVTLIRVGLFEMLDKVFLRSFVSIFHDYGLTVGLFDYTITFGDDKLRSGASDIIFNTGTNGWSLVAEKRHSLFLHGTTHECTVDTVLFHEWNKSGGDTENFLMSGIDVSHLSRFNLNWLTVHTSGDPFVFKFAFGVQFYRSISDHHIALDTSIDIDNFIGDFTIFHNNIWSFDEAIFVNTSVGSEV